MPKPGATSKAVAFTLPLAALKSHLRLFYAAPPTDLTSLYRSFLWHRPPESSCPRQGLLHHPNRPCRQGKRHQIHSLDLTSSLGQSLLQSMFQQPGLAWVHWAPPCGTFSRAREIRRPGAPPPLRNQRHIKGFPHLRGTNLRRVQSANALVEFVAAQCRALSAKGICWSIENPTNSLMWSYPDLARAIDASHCVTFDACMHGSRRRKSTTIRANRSWFQGLQRTCDGSHAHLPWGLARDQGRLVWSTALESAYPKP